MPETPKYVLVSPDGNEHPTSSETYRQRLLGQGYKDKPTHTAGPVRPAPQAEPQPQAARTKPERPEPKPDN